MEQSDKRNPCISYGHVKYQVGSLNQNETGFVVLKINELMIPNSLNDMTWTPASWGNQMTLSRHVPEKITPHILGIIEKLITGTNFTIETILKKALFAVHPGGPKIIDTIAETLKLNHEQISSSRAILLNGGNRSSATLPLIWEMILAHGHPTQTPVISLAFGPGLTIYSSLFIID